MNETKKKLKKNKYSKKRIKIFFVNFNFQNLKLKKIGGEDREPGRDLEIEKNKIIIANINIHLQNTRTQLQIK